MGCKSRHVSGDMRELNSSSVSLGLDMVNLEVLEHSGEPQEQKDAAKVSKLLKRGRHWVLVCLLLSNVIVNE